MSLVQPALGDLPTVHGLAKNTPSKTSHHGFLTNFAINLSASPNIQRNSCNLIKPHYEKKNDL